MVTVPDKPPEAPDVIVSVIVAVIPAFDGIREGAAAYITPEPISSPRMSVPIANAVGFIEIPKQQVQPKMYLRVPKTQ